jgi:Family of unknown function (DUF5343)/Transposase DDE domain
MALSSSYVQVYGQLPEIFARISEAQAPTKFSVQYLKDLGFSSSNCRAVIPLLKALGFLTPDGAPTNRYLEYRNSARSLALSYNAQISTDAAQGLIVGVAVTQEPNDSGQLLPAVDRLEQRLEKKPQQMVADSGYTTRENIEKMAGREIDFLGTMRYENVPRGANVNSG